MHIAYFNTHVFFPDPGVMMATKSKGGGRARPEAAWTFLTNHALVLLLLSSTTVADSESFGVDRL